MQRANKAGFWNEIAALCSLAGGEPSSRDGALRADQHNGVDLEARGQLLEVVDGDVAHRTFDLTNVGPMEAAFVTELFL